MKLKYGPFEKVNEIDKPQYIYNWKKRGKKPKLPISEMREEIIKITEAKGRLPQDGPLWDERYFELKTIKNQEI